MIHCISIALFKQTSELHVLVPMQGTKILIRYLPFFILLSVPIIVNGIYNSEMSPCFLFFRLIRYVTRWQLWVITALPSACHK